VANAGTNGELSINFVALQEFEALELAINFF
jgi:hypothetical protein